MPYLRIIVDDDPSQSGPGPMNLVDMGLSQAIVGWATRSMLSTVSTKGMQKVSSKISADFDLFNSYTIQLHGVSILLCCNGSGALASRGHQDSGGD